MRQNAEPSCYKEGRGINEHPTFTTIRSLQNDRPENYQEQHTGERYEASIVRSVLEACGTEDRELAPNGAFGKRRSNGGGHPTTITRAGLFGRFRHVR